MEKSRAIELLEHLAWDRDIKRNPYGDALNMAIEALKAQLSCGGTTSDTISRQAAIDALNKQIQQCRKALGSLSLSDVDKHAVEVKMASLRAYRGMLENLPTIEPEPQEGRWINTNPEYKNGFYNNSYYCSECHDYYTTSPYEMKFCPNCGAKMTISTK